jgi:hypothetical protein
MRHDPRLTEREPGRPDDGKNQNKLQMWFLRRPLTAFLASNLLAQFSRQIVVQIIGMASPKVCGNLALLPFRGICSTMNLLEICS